jgi:hypothetical protein
MKPGFLKFFLPLAVLCGCALQSDPAAEYARTQARREPEWRIADAAKWLFHATRGGEHAVQSEFAARKWLEQEWATLGPPQPHEPLWTPLMPDGRIGRLNLRPYKAAGGSSAALLAAFLASAESFAGSPARFRAAWRAFGRALKTEPAGFLTYPEWQRLDRDLRAQNYPAIHHSPEYEAARHPAYRVLTATAAAPLLDGQALQQPPLPAQTPPP